MNMCAERPECPYRVVVRAYLIDEICFAESPADAAAAVAENHELDALLEAIEAEVAEVPAGSFQRYVIRAYPMVFYEAEAEPEEEAAARRCQLCNAEPCTDETHGRRASVETDSLAGPARLSADSADGRP